MLQAPARLLNRRQDLSASCSVMVKLSFKYQPAYRAAADRQRDSEQNGGFGKHI